jgi:hypothetical protein
MWQSFLVTGGLLQDGFQTLHHLFVKLFFSTRSKRPYFAERASLPSKALG